MSFRLHQCRRHRRRAERGEIFYKLSIHSFEMTGLVTPKMTYNLAPMFDLSNARFAFLDLETTGLSPWFGDRICEVGIVISEGKRIKEQYQTLVNPERPLSVGAASTNGLTDEELESAPLFAEVGPKVLGLLSDTVVVCHNAKFDLQFLDKEFKQAGA